MAWWSFEPRGEARADWRTALQTQQLLSMMVSLVSKHPQPILADELLLGFRDSDDLGGDEEDPEATSEEIELSAALLRDRVALLRSREVH